MREDAIGLLSMPKGLQLSLNRSSFLKERGTNCKILWQTFIKKLSEFDLGLVEKDEIKGGRFQSTTSWIWLNNFRV